MDNFRDSYFNVTWDLTQKHLRGIFWGKQYDTGRGFAVTIVEGGKVTTPSNETVRLKWEKPDSTEGYVTAVVVDGKFIIENIDQMFTVHGAVRSDLEIWRGGKVISSITFYVTVEKAVAVDAIESSSQFTALQNAVATVDNIAQEIIDARQGEVSVGANITEVKSQLAQKATKGDIGLTDMNKNITQFDETWFADSVKQQWAGTTPVNSTPPDGGVTTVKLANKAVTTDKADFIEKIEMGMQSTDVSNDFTFNGRVSTQNGILNPATEGYKTTDFINVEEATFVFRYVRDGSLTGVFTAYQGSFYSDTNESSFISGVSPGTSYEVTTYEGMHGYKYVVPEGAKYARFSIPDSNNVNIGTGSVPFYHYLVVKPLTKLKLINDYNSLLIDQIRNDISKEEPPMADANILFLGDSIIGNFRDQTGVTAILEEVTGARVYNGAFGGSRLAYISRTSTLPEVQEKYDRWNSVSGVGIIDTLISGDFTNMEASVSAMDDGLAYFPEVVALLKSINMSDIDIVLFGHGTNDFGTRNILKDETDLNRTDTYYGAYNHVIETLLTAYPHIKVIPITPTWRWWRDSDNNYLYDSNTHEIEGQKLTQFVDVVKDLNQTYHVPVIDNYNNLNMNKFTRGHYFDDGVHLNENGRRALAHRVGNMLKSII